MPGRLNRRLCLVLVVLLLPLMRPSWLSAELIYVNNRLGSDANDGLADRPQGEVSGPVKSIQRGFRLAGPSDTIVIANTGTAYFESIQLVGSRHSGNRQGPFTVIGNGAIVSGAKRVPSIAWREVGRDLWQLKPWRKGHYRLMRDDKPVAEQACVLGADHLPDLAVNHWCVWRGSIYLKTEESEEPGKQGYSIAGLGVGLTLYRVHNVTIVDLTFRHFRLDGINAPDGCGNITLENVTMSQNGRAGLAVGGTSTMTVRNSALTENRQHSLLITELGAAELFETEVSQPPTVNGQRIEKSENKKSSTDAAPHKD